MAYYFFTDTDQLFNQSLNGEFGSITNSGTNSEKFQITSKQNCEVNSKAYAISDGLIMIQPNDSDSNLVNIVLKPTKQAIDSIAIEYYIYRGVKKDSIFSSNLINPSGNDLCVQVNNTITKLNQKYPSDTHTREEYILSFGAVAENDLLISIPPLGGIVGNITLDEVFNVKNLLYKPFKISGGSYIGDFNSEFGIDVLLEKAEATIFEARKADNYIISQKQIGLTGEDLIDNKVEKEKILHYFDIYQFYALNYEKVEISIKTTGNAFEKISIKKDDQNKFVAIKNHFINGEWTFIDIRNHYNQSINFDNIITDYLSVKLVEATGYIDYTLPKWPLLKFQIPGLKSITLRIPKSDFTNTLAYVRESNEDSYNFKAIHFDTSNYSTPIKLKLPKAHDGTTIGNYFYFMFLKEIDHDSLPTEWVIKPEHFVDTLFDIEELLFVNNSNELKIKGLRHATKPTKWKINNSNAVVFKNEKSFMAKTGVAEDAQNMYFFAFSNGESPQNSSFDLPIVTGEDDRPKFVDDIIQPKFGDAFTFYSYHAQVVGSPVYVLKDNVDMSTITDSTALMAPNKNDFVMIAIDKLDGVPKLKSVYSQFANNLPKRLKLKEYHEVTETDGKKYWQGDVYVVGYANSTTTSSFEVKEIDTNIKLIAKSPFQSFLGTNIFNELYLKDEFEINGMHFFGLSNKNTQGKLRTSPYLASSDSIIGVFGLENYDFKVLGKCEGSEYDGSTKWYYIELLENLKSSNKYLGHHNNANELPIVPKGTKGFLHSKFVSYIYAKFSKFEEDFIKLNADFDAKSYAIDDNLLDRAIRIRQRSHNSDVRLFDVILSGDWWGNNGWHDVDHSEFLDNLIDEVQGIKVVDNITVNLNIQLFKDYSGVQFYNGKIADIQHLMVGYEVIDFPGTVGFLNYGEMFNLNIALAAGDGGTVPAAILDAITPAPLTDVPEVVNFINECYRSEVSRDMTPEELAEALYVHFQNANFSEFDMYGDLYCYGLKVVSNEIRQADSSLTPSEHLLRMFTKFNKGLESKYEESSLNSYFQINNFDISIPLYQSNANFALIAPILADTLVFATIFYHLKLRPWMPNIPEGTQLLEQYSNISMFDFLNFLNRIYFKYK